MLRDEEIRMRYEGGELRYELGSDLNLDPLKYFLSGSGKTMRIRIRKTALMSYNDFPVSC